MFTLSPFKIYFNWRQLVYSIVVVLPYIDMSQPRVHMCPPIPLGCPYSSRCAAN